MVRAVVLQDALSAQFHHPWRDVPGIDEEPGGAAAPRMLAVVRLGGGGELTTLERLGAVCEEHCPQLVIVGVWRPAWWLCLRAGCVDLAPLLAAERSHCDVLLRDYAAVLGAEVRPTVVLGPVGAAVDRELEQRRYQFLIGPRAILPSRRVRRWRTRHPWLAVLAV